MSELFSQVELEAIQRAQEADDLLDPELAMRIGVLMAEKIHKLQNRPTPWRVVALDGPVLGSQLGAMVARRLRNRLVPVDFVWIERDEYGFPHLDLVEPITGGHTALVSVSEPSSRDLASVVGEIRRSGTAQVTDMVLVAGGPWHFPQPSDANALGVHVELLVPRAAPADFPGQADAIQV